MGTGEHRGLVSESTILGLMIPLTAHSALAIGCIWEDSGALCILGKHRVGAGGRGRQSSQQAPLERLEKESITPLRGAFGDFSVLPSPGGPSAPGSFGREKSTINFFLGNWGPSSNALWHAQASSPFVFLQSCIPAARLSYKQIANPPGNPPAPPSLAAAFLALQSLQKEDAASGPHANVVSRKALHSRTEGD